KVAISADGTKATAGWQRSNGTYTIIQSSSAAIANNVAAWSSVIDLSSTGQNAGSVSIGLSSGGSRASVVWSKGLIQSSSVDIPEGIETRTPNPISSPTVTSNPTLSPTVTPSPTLTPISAPGAELTLKEMGKIKSGKANVRVMAARTTEDNSTPLANVQG